MGPSSRILSPAIASGCVSNHGALAANGRINLGSIFPCPVAYGRRKAGRALGLQQVDLSSVNKFGADVAATSVAITVSATGLVKTRITDRCALIIQTATPMVIAARYSSAVALCRY